MRMQVLVTLDVEPCEPNAFVGSQRSFSKAAGEAITHALEYGEGEGFVHELSNDVSIQVASVEHYAGQHGF